MADEFKPSNECRAVVVKPPAINIDVSSHFVTERAFETKEELVKWARDVVTPLRFTIVVLRSDNGTASTKLFILLACERGGAYKPTRKKLKKEGLGTRKCGCSFRLRGYFHATRKCHVRVTNGTRNHDLDNALQGHLIAGR
jgi:hypothetical protein